MLLPYLIFSHHNLKGNRLDPDHLDLHCFLKRTYPGLVAWAMDKSADNLANSLDPAGGTQISGPTICRPDLDPNYLTFRLYS